MWLELLAGIIIAAIGAASAIIAKKILPRAEQVNLERKTSVETESMSVETMQIVVKELREEMVRVRTEVKGLRDELANIKTVFRLATRTLEQFIRWAGKKELDDYPHVPEEILPYMSFNIDRRRGDPK